MLSIRGMYNCKMVNQLTDEIVFPVNIFGPEKEATLDIPAVADVQARQTGNIFPFWSRILSFLALLHSGEA